MNDASRMPCPECGESIPVVAKSCRFCQCVISDKDRVAARPVEPAPRDAKAASAKQTFRKRFSRRVAHEESPITAEERGLAIAALVIACIMAMGVIPAFSFVLVGELRNYILGFIPIAGLAGGLGYAGKKSAMGIAALALSAVTMIEAGITFGYHRYQLHEAEIARLNAEREERERQSRENVIQNARRAQAEANAKAAEAKASVERAKIEAQSTDSRERYRREQEQSAADAARRDVASRERAIRNELAEAKTQVEREEAERKQQQINIENRAAADREQQRAEKAAKVDDMKRQIADADQRIADAKANLPIVQPAGMGREALERNRKLVEQNLKNIHATNKNGAYTDLLEKEQAKLERIERDLQALSQNDVAKRNRQEAERRLVVLVEARDALTVKLYEIAPELKPSGAQPKANINAGDPQ